MMATTATGLLAGRLPGLHTMPGAISNGSFRFASACAASARCSSLNASRFAKAAARRSAFEAPTVMQLLFRRATFSLSSPALCAIAHWCG